MESTRFLFGDYELDAAQRELRCSGERIDLQPKVFDLLLHLVRNRERAVGKDELQDAVWPGMVITETALTRAVMKARKAVGDDASAQSVIRTVHGHGYHFIAPVHEVHAKGTPPASVGDGTGSSSRLVLLLAALAVVCIAVYGLWQYYPARVLEDDYKAVELTLEAYRGAGDAVVLYTDRDWPVFDYHHPEDWLGIPNGQWMTSETAGQWAAAFWASMTVGRILLGLIVDRLPIEPLVRGCVLGAVLGAAAFWWAPLPWVGLAGLIVIGLCLAPLFPVLTSATRQRLGAAHATDALGYQMTAVRLGLAAFPALGGVLVARVGVSSLGPYLTVSAILVIVLNELTLWSAAERPPSVSPAEPTGKT